MFSLIFQHSSETVRKTLPGHTQVLASWQQGDDLKAGESQQASADARSPPKSEHGAAEPSSAAKARTAVEVIEAAAARGVGGRAAEQESSTGWEYLIKFKGRGYVHAKWIPDDTLKAAGKLVPSVARKVQNFLRALAANPVRERPPCGASFA